MEPRYVAFEGVCRFLSYVLLLSLSLCVSNFADRFLDGSAFRLSHLKLEPGIVDETMYVLYHRALLPSNCVERDTAR